jgi:hypothetical protein
MLTYPPLYRLLIYLPLLPIKGWRRMALRRYDYPIWVFGIDGGRHRLHVATTQSAYDKSSAIVSSMIIPKSLYNLLTIITATYCVPQWGGSAVYNLIPTASVP